MIRSYIVSVDFPSRVSRLLKRRNSTHWRSLGVLCVTLLAYSPVVLAAPINYGTLMGNTVSYVDVTEDANSFGDAPPLFGAPTVSGDTLDFNPVGFNANASGALGNDVTDGNLAFMVVAKQGNAINSLSLGEAGDTTLAGFGTDATRTSVAGFGVLNINEVDGVGINVISVPFTMTFSPLGGVYRLLSDFPLGGGTIGWSGGVLLNINSILASHGQPYVLGATKISINLDNVLRASSEAGTASLIAKKDFGGLSVTVNVPEPTAGLLAGLAVLGLFAARRW